MLNLFSHYTPSITFKKWLTWIAEHFDNEPSQFILYMLNMYSFLSAQEENGTIEPMHLELLNHIREWFTEQMQAAMSADNSVQIYFPEVDIMYFAQEPFYDV